MTGPELPDLPGLRLTHRLGHGGSGAVYAAHRLVDAKPVAVKVLRDEYAAPRARRRLREEARRARRVEHPAVVKVFDVGEHNDVTWLVMELVDGPSLQDVLDRHGALPPALAVELIARAADALAAIHAAGLAHGDVKPANLLLPGWSGPEGTIDVRAPVKVVDFGLSRPLPGGTNLDLSQDTDWLHTNATISEHWAGGTVAFMAPEQWRGEAVTAQSDVYALGGTLYAALTGTQPFAHSSLAQLAYAVATDPPPAPSALVPTVPATVDAVVQRALAKDPADRQPEAAAFAAALRHASTAIDGAAPHAMPYVPALSRPRLARRMIRTAGRAVSPVLLIFALLFFGAGFLTVSCTPNGYGRAAAGATTTYTGGDLATGSRPDVDKLRPAGQAQPDRLGVQPFITLAALLLIAGALVAFVLRRGGPSRFRTIASIATAAAACLIVGEALARSAITDRLANQLTTPLPANRHVSDYVHVAGGFWASLLLTVVAALGNTAAAIRASLRDRRRT